MEGRRHRTRECNGSGRLSLRISTSPPRTAAGRSFAYASRALVEAAATHLESALLKRNSASPPAGLTPARYRRSSSSPTGTVTRGPRRSSATTRSSTSSRLASSCFPAPASRRILPTRPRSLASRCGSSATRERRCAFSIPQIHTGAKPSSACHSLSQFIALSQESRLRCSYRPSFMSARTGRIRVRLFRIQVWIPNTSEIG